MQISIANIKLCNGVLCVFDVFRLAIRSCAIKKRKDTRMGEKLAPRYFGPYTIIEELGKGVYHLKDAKGPLKQTANSANLTMWHEQTDVTKTPSPISDTPPTKSPTPTRDMPPTPIRDMPRASKAPTPISEKSSASKLPSPIHDKSPVRSTVNSQLGRQELQALLRPTEWLNDKHIDAVNGLLARHLGNPTNQSTLLVQSASGYDSVQHETVQILYDNNHWVTTACIGSEVLFMDSLGKPMSQNVKKQIRQLYSACVSGDVLPVTVMPCSRQPNSHDCGLYAAAFAFDLVLSGRDAEYKLYENELMRTHLVNCLTKRFSRHSHWRKNRHVGVEHREKS